MSGADESAAATDPLTREETGDMTQVTCDMAMSVDGFLAGPNQSLAKPFAAVDLERLDVTATGLVTHMTYRVLR